MLSRAWAIASTLKNRPGIQVDIQTVRGSGLSDVPAEAHQTACCRIGIKLARAGCLDSIEPGWRQPDVSAALRFEQHKVKAKPCLTHAPFFGCLSSLPTADLRQVRDQEHMYSTEICTTGKPMVSPRD